MARAARSNDDIPRPPMSRPNLGLVGWVIFGLAVAAALAYGFLRARGPALVGAGVPLERPPGSVVNGPSLGAHKPSACRG